MIREARRFLGAVLVAVGHRLAGDRNPGFGEEPEDEDEDPIPGAPVRLSTRAREMVREGADAPPPAPASGVSPVLSGSLTDRIERARARAHGT